MRTNSGGDALIIVSVCDYMGTWSRPYIEQGYFVLRVDPKRGSWQWMHLGGKSERTKELRSMTPTGFARSFAQANG